MIKAIVIFLNIIQPLDILWRIFVTFLSFVLCIYLALFVFFPIILSVLQWLLNLFLRSILVVTNFCMRTWGHLVISWRKKAGKYPQLLVSIEDFFVTVITGILKFIGKVVQWKPNYGAICKRIVLVSVIFILLLGVSLWVLPSPSQVLASFYRDWENEYVMGADQPTAVIVDTLSPGKNAEKQIYYRLSGESANFRKTPDGEIITTITDPGLLIRYLGKKEAQWLYTEFFDQKQRVVGWIHESVVSQWEIAKKPFLFLEPNDSVRISTSGVPIFTCRLVGLKQADDGKVTVIFETK